MKKMKRLARIKNQEGKNPVTYAQENAQAAVCSLFKTYNCEASQADRNQCIQELAKKLIDEPADYSKSIFKVRPEKITLIGKKMSRNDIVREK